MTLLLDTVTFLHLAAEPEKLSARAREALVDPGHVLVLHQASAWEMQIKYDLGKLSLKGSPQAFIERALEAHQLLYHRLEDEDIWHLAKLPHLHRDPFDRLLVAHAVQRGLPIVTPDRHIHAYPVRAIW